MKNKIVATLVSIYRLFVIGSSLVIACEAIYGVCQFEDALTSSSWRVFAGELLAVAMIALAVVHLKEYISRNEK